MFFFLRAWFFVNLAIYSQCLFSQEPLVINGFGSLVKQTVNGNVTINGSAIVDNSKISGILYVNGSLSATSSAITKVLVNGSFVGKNVDISFPSQVQGAFEAIDSKFGDLEISSDSVILENCTAKDIVLSKMNNGDQVIQIKGDSKIESITFESKGVIKKSSGTIIKTIKNATIEND